MTRTRATSRLATAASSIVGEQHVRSEPGQLIAHSHDAIALQRGNPDLVVFPASTEEVSALLRLADQESVPVIPRGGGSNSCGATVPIDSGMIVVLTRMDRILEINPDELLARVPPGVVTHTLANAVASHGLLFPPDPRRHPGSDLS